MKIFYIFTFFFLLFSLLIAFDITEIRQSENYISGYGEAETFEEADQKALLNLISQISTNVKADFTDIYVETDGSLEEFSRRQVNTYSNIMLQNAKSKVDETSKAGKIIVLRYIQKEDLEMIFQERKKKILDYTSNAIKAEDDLRIGDALRYYYAAFMLLRSHPENNSLSYCFDKHNQQTLITALPDRMGSIFSTLKFKREKEYYYEDERRRLIYLTLFYKSKKVQNLDFSYYTGDTWSRNITVKDGIGVMEFFDDYATESKDLDLKIEYQYYNQRNFDAELRTVMEDTYRPVFPTSRIKVYTDNQIERTYNNITTPEIDIQPTDESYAESKYDDILQDVIRAISQKDYDDLADKFTVKGYDNFQKIIAYGNASLINEEVRLYSTNFRDKTIIRPLPMLFSFPDNDRQFIEKLAFIFDKEGKIDAVTFTLSENAINDILDHSERWGTLENKYQIIQFMEYYKTAYCLKDIDFIEKVFADNALIIVGVVLKEDRPIENMYKNLGDRIEYIRLDKRNYIERLKTVFSSNQYVNIHFEDNEVKKLLGNDENKDTKIYSIQIAQNYYSSNYADKGYLYLMMDLSDDENPRIYVRTWQPEKRSDDEVFKIQDFINY
ncbi:MAG: LPP20 family lipoprotein [Candidatus Cloacimonetes bacterium]|nr:LPP20 family lipoprotein [Candidatus Cloacimonadota bacterium]